jgi:hypothetical protein
VPPTHVAIATLCSAWLTSWILSLTMGGGYPEPAAPYAEVSGPSGSMRSTHRARQAGGSHGSPK